MDLIAALPAGATLGDYVIGEPIHRGGFGIIYEAWHPRRGDVAVKEFFPIGQARRDTDGSLVASPGDQETFRKQADRFACVGNKLAAVSDPNIVRVHEVLAANNTAYLVMERLQGSTLARTVGDGRAAPELIRDILGQMTCALTTAHRAGLLHLDISPDNIFVDARGARFALIDFGAKATTRCDQEDGGPPFYLRYLAPEVVPDRPLPASDIYGLCAVLRWLILGGVSTRFSAYDNRQPLAPPSRRNKSQAAYYGYDVGLLRAVDRGLSLSCRNRQQSIEEFSRSVAKSAPVQSSSKSFLQRLSAVASAVLHDTASARSDGYLFAGGRSIRALQSET